MAKGALIVTGGSRGIGAATAIMAAKDAWPVVVNFHSNSAAADKVVAEIEANGGQALAVQADVGNEADVIRLFEAAEEKFGSVGGLVNNAGILHRATQFADIELDRWNDTLATNLTGSFLCAREAVRRMLKAGEGTIVNLSSMAAVLGGAGEFVDYASSKGAVDTMTLGMARELAGKNIRVNGVRPGLIDTEMQASSGDPDRAHRLASSVPMQRVGQSDEVADMIVFLLSERASYVTGQIINVSGGR